MDESTSEEESELIYDLQSIYTVTVPCPMFNVLFHRHLVNFNCSNTIHKSIQFNIQCTLESVLSTEEKGEKGQISKRGETQRVLSLECWVLKLRVESVEWVKIQKSTAGDKKANLKWRSWGVSGAKNQLVVKYCFNQIQKCYWFFPLFFLSSSLSLYFIFLSTFFKHLIQRQI